MKIVVDENIPYAEAFFAGFGELVSVAGRHLSSEHLQGADALLVRSVARVNAELLQASPVKFVATATIGTDHIDQAYLLEQGIAFANAPGCNAEGVVDYVLSALFNLAVTTGVPVTDRNIGIVGAGNVGSRLYRRLEALGCRLWVNDPPLAATGNNDFPLCSLDTVLEQCDVICLHTPLIKTGSHPTLHLLNDARIKRIKPGSCLLNAGRGAVIDNAALNERLRTAQDLHVVLDVWETEPGFNAELARRVCWGTPHIAGYSFEGRARGTEMIYQAFCQHLGVSPSVQLASLLPSVEALDGSVVKACLSQANNGLTAFINHCYDMRMDAADFAALIDLDDAKRAAAFDQLRKNYHQRRELSAYKISQTGLESEQQIKQLTALGYTLI